MSKKPSPKKNAKLLYVYDFLHMWTFFVELLQIENKKSESNYPLTICRHGQVTLKISSKKLAMKDQDEFLIYQEDKIGQMFGGLETEEFKEGYYE